MKTFLQIQTNVRKCSARWCTALVCTLSLSASAATYTWTGTGWFGQDYLWSNDFNWAGGVAPSSGEANVTIVFPNNASPKVTTNDIVGLTVASIQFQGGSYVVHGKPAGNALGFYSGGLLGWAITANANGSYFASTCPLVLSNSGTVNVAAGCTLSALSSISGAGGVFKTGPGTLKYSAAAANTYGGTTTVSDGTLDLNSGILFPSETSYVSVPGPLVIGGTNLAYSPVVRLLFDNQIANTAPITVNENGLLALNGHDDVLGPVTLSGGVIDTDVIGGPSAPGTWSLNSNVTNLLSASGAEARISGQIYLGAFARTFRVETDSQLKIDASIGDSPVFDPGFIKSGPGRLVLSNAPSSYTGPTVVSEGALRLQGSNTLLGATSAGTVVTTNGTLELDKAQIGDEPLELNGAPGKTSLLFMANKWNRWTGPITLNGECGIVGWDVSLVEHGLDISGVISGSGKVRKGGNGTLKLSGVGANTFTGGMDVKMGWVVMEKLGNMPALSGPLVVGVTNAQVDPYDSYVSVSDWNQIPDQLPVAVYHTGQLIVQPSVVEVLGHLTMAGGLVRSWGYLSLSGNITNKPAPTDNGYQTAYLSGNVELPSGTHVFDCTHIMATLKLSANLSGDGALTKAGPGSLELSGTNTYSGLTWVQDGILELQDGARPGSTAAGTVIEPPALLYLFHSSVTNETLTFKGSLPGFNDYNLTGGWGTNRWRGPIVLQGDARLLTLQRLILDGPISGPGGLIFDQGSQLQGTIELAGASANTYAGATTVKAATLELNKSAGPAIPGDLNIVGTTNLWYGTNLWCTVRLRQPHQIGDLSAVTIGSNHSLVLGGNAEAIGWLWGNGKVDLGSATLTTGDGGSSTFDGLISGSGGLTKVGYRTFTLAGNNTYTGTTTINDGVLMVFGQQPGSAVSVANGARLGGSGRVGNLSDLNGHVWPGASPGILACGNFSTFTPANQLQIEINGLTPGSYDQLQVNGSVLLMGGTLHLTTAIAGAVSNQYVIVSNDGADPVSGTFTGLPQGSQLTNNGAVFQITYQGGDGNDVALIQQTVGFASQISSVNQLGNGGVQITAAGVPNASYTVQATASLNAPVTWTALGQAAADDAGLVQFTDPDASQFPVRFYRLKYP